MHVEMAERKKLAAQEIELTLKHGDYRNAANLCENAIGLLDDSEIERYIKPIVEEVRRALQQKETGLADALLVSLVRISDKMYKDTANGFVFSNTVEFMLYVSRHNKENVIWIRSPRLEVYYLYGYFLVETNRLAQAQAIFKKALQFAPAAIMVYLEYAETFKAQRDFEMFAALTLQGMQYAARKEHVARCLRNIGFFEIENENLRLASVYYYLSMEYDQQNPTAMKELRYIYSVAGEIFPKPGEKEKERVLNDVCRRAGLTKEQLPQKA